MFTDASSEEINTTMINAWQAFHQYRKIPLKKRADFMRAIGMKLKSLEDELVEIAMKESNLPEGRLRGELGRTILQLNQYGTAAENGEFLEVRIDTTIPGKQPANPDIRKMMIPLGPVVVFGASNFPFAFSTAGGDTACAFAAGCPVIVKAHPAHSQTSQKVAEAILNVAGKLNMPEGIFAHIHGKDTEVGKALVMHSHTKAVSFTGSQKGGKQLFDWGNQRKVPIPVFAEMGSINPVFLLPEKLKMSSGEIATTYAGSITQGVGQFCTNPGLIVGVEGDDLENFIAVLSREIEKIAPAKMLHEGITKSFNENRNVALKQNNVTTIFNPDIPENECDGIPTIASATGKDFLDNPILHQEVFGPYSLIIRCKDMQEMKEVAKHLEGQLTATLMATENDIISNDELIESVKNICGRFLLNGVPTGVEVCLSMHHGGPYPATTDSRFTSVGADGIKRFVRPLAFQNWANNLLPDELKNENPLHIWRTVNNELTKDAIQ